MTNNCLKEVLKGTVTNDSLAKVGELKLVIKKNATTPSQYASELPLKNSKSFVVRATGGAYFTEAYNTGTHLTELTIPANTSKNIYVGNEDGYIFVSEKYTLDTIGDGYVKNVIITYADTADFKYSTPLRYLTIGNGLVGNAANLSGLTNLYYLFAGGCYSEDLSFVKSSSLVYLYLDGNDLKGNISELPTLNSLTNLTIDCAKNIKGTATNLANFPVACSIDIHGSGITGSIEDLVSALIAKGNATYDGKNLRTLPVFDTLTFGGQHWGTGAQYTFLSWESASKIWLSCLGTTLQTCTKVFCKGYTQVEAEAKWPGKTIVRVDA